MFGSLTSSCRPLTSGPGEAVLCDGVGGAGEAEGVVRRRRAVHQQELARLHQEEVAAQLPASRRHPAEKLRSHTGDGGGAMTVQPMTTE